LECKKKKVLRTRKNLFLNSKNKNSKDAKIAFFGGLAERLSSFCVDFIPVFKSKTRSSSLSLCEVLTTFAISDKANCQSLSRVSPKENIYQNLHHFITKAKWCYKAVFSQIATTFINSLPELWHDDLCLLIDESGIPKKGTKSDGVAHQYCGQHGKQENSQVGVFSVLHCRKFYTTIGASLHLPKSSIGRNKIKAETPHKTKVEQALTLIKDSFCIKKLPVKWVCFDALYGRSVALLTALNKENIVFFGDIAQNIKVFTTKPSFSLPEKQPGKRGRTATKLKADIESTAVSRIASNLTSDQWQECKIRKLQDGKPLMAKLYRCIVWVYDEECDEVMELALLIRKDADGAVRYCLTNACKDLSLQRMGYMQGCRYFVERNFQEHKQHLGMNSYQIRDSEGWHKHMALCALTGLFITSVKIEQSICKDYPIHITTRELKSICKLILKCRRLTLESVVAEILHNNLINEISIE
jgi:SRSO17 transposase